MILLIDNYDSFSYNLFQLVGSLNPDIRVIRNDEMMVREIETLNLEAIILSPGPGKPCDAGICKETVRHFDGKVPILGVCLGHQVICEAFGSTVSYAKTLMHGKQSKVKIDNRSILFKGLPEEIQGGRYHSLAAIEDTVPDILEVIARSEDGEVMAVKHRSHEVYGLQFHPESILTPDGAVILKNFLSADKSGGTASIEGGKRP